MTDRTAGGLIGILIGAITTLGVAALGNWEKLFPPQATPQVTSSASKTPTAPTPRLRKAKVLFVDTDAEGERYGTRMAKGETNADLLARQISKNTLLGSIMEPEVRNGRKADFGVVDADVVVIHRSAFGDATADPELRKFLVRNSGTDAVFLVYSRKDETDGRYARELQTDSGLAGRVFAYQFRKGQPPPFDQTATVDQFISTVRTFAEAQLYRSVSSQLQAKMP